MRRNKKLSFRLFGVVAILSCSVLPVFGQFEQESEGVFGKAFEKDDSVLKGNPGIAQAHEEWKAAIVDATDKYVKGMEDLFEREKSKGDFEAIKTFEKWLGFARTQHKSPCILFDRLPSKAASLLAIMNKAKSKANKAWIDLLEKEIAAAVKKKEIETAKKIEQFLGLCFVPAMMEVTIPDVVRFKNKAYLIVGTPKTWQDAYEFCRERNADLASVGSRDEHLFLNKQLEKTGRTKQALIGGYKTGNNWNWTDGTPFNFVVWAPGQPTVIFKGKIEDRISMGEDRTGGWNDVSSLESHRFVLQWTLY